MRALKAKLGSSYFILKAMKSHKKILAEQLHVEMCQITLATVEKMDWKNGLKAGITTKMATAAILVRDDNCGAEWYPGNREKPWIQQILRTKNPTGLSN